MKLNIEDWKIDLETEIIGHKKKQILKDLERYLNGEEMYFNYGIDFSDFTEFQRSVLRGMKKISYGHIMSYSEIAKRIGKPRSQRTVGNTCNKNPLPIIIPCHHVVAKDGIGGYSYDLNLKKYLLSLENS